MTKITVLTTKGTGSGEITLPKEIFEAKVNPRLMAQAVRVYLANQRRAGAKVKTRGEVKRTKAKWYRQKGTGRARHGARSVNIFVGGGVVHGPTGKENYALKMSKKMKKAALFSALTTKYQAKEILVVKGLDKLEPKTKLIVQTLVDLKLRGKKVKKESKLLLVLPQMLENLIRASNNIARLDSAQANQLNTYQVLNSGKLVFLPESLDKLKETFLGKKAEEKKRVVEAKPKRRKRGVGVGTIFETLRTRGLLRQVSRLLRDVLGCLKIRDLAANFTVGLGDPADTGFLFAFIGPATFFLGSSFPHRIRIQPSFEDEAVCEGYLCGTVRVVPIRMVTPGVRFAFSLPAIRIVKRLVVAKWKRKK